MTRSLRELDINTQLVHAGERGPIPTGHPVTMPIYPTATYTYGSMAEVDQVFAGEKPGFVYTRYGNPTVASLEESMTILENGAGACAYASGMAALHATLFACELSPGATILASADLYGATIQLLDTVFGSFGVKTVTADFNDAKALAERAREVRPQVLLAETISNPLLKVCDLEACAEIARAANARLIVDNTFATPYLCRPLEHGADFAVHSATKYLGGHADAMGGVTVARDAADLPALVSTMKLVGGVLGVWDAHEISRGLRTLALRVERQCENARRLAEHLARAPQVARAYYPSLGDTNNQDVVGRMLRAPHRGALVSVVLRQDTRDAAFAFMDALRLCVRATSLGDVFTSVLHPATASHRDLAPARRRALGIADSLVRISVGVEHGADIIADIDQALAVVGRR